MRPNQISWCAAAFLPLTWLLQMPTVATAQMDDDFIFTLPEFVVQDNRDRGYTATNSMTGTFLDTPLILLC